MSFIYRAPLHLLVSARIDGWPLRFNETASLLLKYVDHDHDISRQLDEAEPGVSRVLPIAGVLRSDGVTALAHDWWRIFDLGPAPARQRNANVRIARLNFYGLEFANHIARRGCVENEDLALHDAFVEQDSIQLLVELRDAQVQVCQAALVLKLAVDSQGRSPHPVPTSR